MHYNQYIKAYLNILNEASYTGTTPPNLIQKIFADIKRQDFQQSFVLTYNDKDIYRFLPPNYKRIFNDQIFNMGKELKYLIILNIKIYNSQDEIQNYYKNINNLIEKTKNKQNININKYEIFQQYLDFIQTLLDENEISKIQALPQNISYFIINKCIEKFVPSLKVDKRLSLLNTLLFIKKDLQRIISRISTVYGLTVFQPFNNCSLILINNKLFHQKKLTQIYTVLNHELDHLFFYKLKQVTKLNNHLDQLSENELLHYLTDPTQINSRITDLCNILNNKIIPIQNNNALESLLLFLKSNYKKYNQLKEIISVEQNNYKWLSNLSDADIQTIYTAMIYFNFEKLQKFVIDRLQKEFNTFTKKYNNNKKLYKYKQSIKRKFR